MALESEDAHVQGIPSMELGGFEPPTSWVRFRALITRYPRESRMTSGFALLAIRRRPSPICADMRRLSGSSGRNADFCLIGPTAGSSESKELLLPGGSACG